MSKKSILHMFDPMPHNSPFDVNMAVDAGFDIIMPYNNVNFEDTQRLVQDAIFSRGPKGVKQTAIFIGGRDMSLAYDMLTASKHAMVPPFEVSVLADPSGAFTTAAALVACVEKALADTTTRTMADCNVVVFGGTGPVGIASGVIASLTGATTTLGITSIYIRLKIRPKNTTGSLTANFKGLLPVTTMKNQPSWQRLILSCVPLKPAFRLLTKHCSQPRHNLKLPAM